jgi:hypothetical protein
MPDELNSIRKDILTRRLAGGSNRIKWSVEAAARVRHHIAEMPERELLRAAEVKLFDSQSAPASIEIPTTMQRAMGATALSWLCTISYESPDLCMDLIKRNGWDLKTSYTLNRPVLFAHKGDLIPVAQSTLPYPSGASALMAAAVFPEPGVSEISDQVRAAVEAGIFRGASVGFIPGKFKFSQDPVRPLGIDFLSGHILTEWSLCAVPCHPLCVVSGPISSGKSASDIADLRREARALAAKARSISESISDPVPSTRAQRLVEAHNLRRIAMAATR